MEWEERQRDYNFRETIGNFRVRKADQWRSRQMGYSGKSRLGRRQEAGLFCRQMEGREALGKDRSGRQGGQGEKQRVEVELGCEGMKRAMSV